MEPKPRPVRRLFWDIEVSPNVVIAFSAGFKLNIFHDQIIQERKVICIGYKFEDDKKVSILRWDKNQDDKSMLKEFVKIATKNFYFNSNKLDYLASFLGYGNKIKTGLQLWKDVMNGSKEALQKMCDYCCHDVLLLEKVYHRFKPYVKPKIHAGVLLGMEPWSDPRTGSTDVKWVKTTTTSSGYPRHQMKNLTDGSFYTITDRAFKIYQKR